MEFKTVPHNSAEYWETVELRQKILRDPLGLKFSDEDLRRESNEIICVCVSDEKIVGCDLLAHVTNETVKLRQMAVDANYQTKGIGSELLRYTENVSRERKYKTIELHARLIAKDFYLKNGYEVISDAFTEVGIPHVKMKKEL